MTEEELFSIITTAITKAVEPLELQIANQKQIIADQSVEVSQLKEQLLEDLLSIEERQNDAGTTAQMITDSIDALKDSFVRLKNVNVKALEELNSTHAVDKQLLEDTLSEYKSNAQDKQVEFEARVLEDVTLFKDNMNSNFEDSSSNLDALANHTNKEIFNTLSLKFETLDLQVMNKITKEHLRLNEHVNASLINLKGEKGDTGEKGDEGESGFVRGVSTWKTGHISKQRETISHNNSLWLCNVEQSAHEPGGSDDYSLIVDGVVDHSVDSEGHLISKYASGKSADLGRILMMFKGEYDEKVTYNKMDLVRLNGNVFRCLRDGNTTRPPSGSKDWEKMLPRGEKGLKGAKGDSPKPADFVAMINDTVDVKLESSQ